jgi:hypothetical protein
MVFRYGTGEMYGGIPSGPCYELIHHAADDILPVAEIETCLRHLDPTPSTTVAPLSALFWDILDHS